MERLNKYIYKIKDASKDKLKSLGFCYSSKYSDSEYVYYIYKFPVKKYKNKAILECELMVNAMTKNVTINVYNTNMKPYAPFYNDRFCTNNRVVDHINKQILKKLKELGIVREW